MRNRKRLIALFLTMILVFTFFPLEATANSAPPAPFYTFELTNIPEGAVYADILILLGEQDKNYVDADRNHLPDGFSADAEILSYCADGYRSYTFHYRDAASSIYLDEDGRVFFFADSEFVTGLEGEVRYEHENEIYNRGDIRIAILDKCGNLLHISPDLTLTCRDYFSYLDNVFYYDAGTQEFQVEYRDSVSMKLIYVILAFCGMLLTCIAELLVATPFGLTKRYKCTIILTNILSQIVMHTAYLSLYSVFFWKYKYVVILLEVLVYTGEYLWYSRQMWDVSQRRVLAYTMTANTTSLVLGMFTTYSLILPF